MLSELTLGQAASRSSWRTSVAADVRDAPEKFFQRCMELTNQLIEAQGIQAGKILGFGVGVPGPVDFARAVLVAPPLMPDWENFPIRSFINNWFPSAFVIVDNDVNIMALGEQRAGDGDGVDHF